MKVKTIALILILVFISGFIFSCSSPGLTEAQRKQAFNDFIVLQGSIPIGDPNEDEKLDKGFSDIAKKYGITEEELSEILLEGLQKNWPIITLK